MASDVAVIHKLTSLADVNRMLHESLAKERTIDSDLDRLLSKRVELERSFLLLNAPTVEMLELIHSDCEQLLDSAKGTADLATHISSKVRTLDTAQTNVMSVLSKISIMVECSTAVSGVKEAMDKNDYEAAAQHIATFTELDARLREHRASRDGAAGDFVSDLNADIGQVESQRAVLLEAKKRLETVVDRQLDEAVTRMDAQGVLRFAALYKPLGKQAEGLKRFLEYVQMTASQQVRSHVGTITDQADTGKKVDWKAALAIIFQSIVKTLETHEAFVKRVFGDASVLDLVTSLQVECDSGGSRIVNRFMEARRVTALVREASNRRGKGSAVSAGGQAGDGGLDHRMLEAAISELLSLCQITEEYNQFILGKMRQSTQGAVTASRETSFRSGALNVGVRELLAHYMALEEMYMYETATMAIRIDETSPGSLTSSMVDDVFFILRKCGVRVLTSGNVQVICALLMELNNVAANQLRNALSQRLAAGPNRLVTAAPAADVSDGYVVIDGPVPEDLTSLPAPAAEHAVALNNSDTAAEYMVKLKAELEKLITDIFSGSASAAAERERVKGALGELHKTAGELRQSNASAVEQLAEAILPRLKPALDKLAAASYTMSESDFAASEAGGDGWAGDMALALRSAVTWLQPVLTQANYESCVSAVLDKTLSRVEALVSRKSFNQLGGLALERDLRVVIASAGELTQRSVRDKFTRLNQMALLLGLESLDELREYWGGDSAITWRLGAADIKTVLAQRQDLSRDAISMLRLV